MLPYPSPSGSLFPWSGRAAQGELTLADGVGFPNRHLRLLSLPMAPLVLHYLLHAFKVCKKCALLFKSREEKKQ